LGQISKNYGTFYTKSSHKALKNMSLGSEIRNKPIPDPDPRVKKAPDPGSGSATLLKTILPSNLVSLDSEIGHGGNYQHCEQFVSLQGNGIILIYQNGTLICCIRYRYHPVHFTG
jgi:hypothetical protein